MLMHLRKGVVMTIGYVWPLTLLSLLSVGFFLIGALENHSFVFWYLIWNLFLAWVPLVFVIWLLPVISRYGWTSWPGILLTLLWLTFLPNSFYMVSDFIHLQDFSRINIVFDAVTFAAFVLTGLLVGFTSVYLVHIELIKRIKKINAWGWVSFVLAICSYAIYLGRDLRMNSWDVFTNPASILFGITDPIVNPRAHVLAFTTTLTFFIFLTSFYVVVWHLISAIARNSAAHLLYTRKQ
jgi:uncharacterized membrane protein